jgi:hypothetical protein
MAEPLPFRAPTGMAEEGRPEYQRLRPPLQKRERTRFEDLAADGEVVVAARNVGRLGVRWGSPATTSRGPTAVSVGWAMRPKPPGSNRENTRRGQTGRTLIVVKRLT